MSSLVLSFRDCAIVYALSKHRDLYLLRGFPSTLSRFRIVESAAVGTRPQCKPHAIRDERAAQRVRHVYSTGFPCGYAQAPCCFVFCRWRRIPQLPDLPNSLTLDTPQTWTPFPVAVVLVRSSRFVEDLEVCFSADDYAATLAKTQL